MANSLKIYKRYLSGLQNAYAIRPRRGGCIKLVIFRSVGVYCMLYKCIQLYSILVHTTYIYRSVYEMERAVSILLRAFRYIV